MKILEERLDLLKAEIAKPDFMHNVGLGNEVGYYVFDYDPADEMKVRTWVSEISKENTRLKFGYDLIVYDLYELMLKLLEEGTLDDLKDLEEEEGTDYVFAAISDILKFDEKDSLIIQYIIEHTPDESVVFLTGVGKCYPILRSHKILNNLHQVMDHCPVIMFFPGRYTGTSLTIFGEAKDDNYYRALPLIPR